MNGIEDHIKLWQLVGETWNDADLDDLERLYKTKVPIAYRKLARKDE